MEQLVLKHQLPSSALLYSKIAELLAFSMMSSASRWSKSRFDFHWTPALQGTDPGLTLIQA